MAPAQESPRILLRIVRASIGACGFCVLSSPVAAAFDASPPQWPFYLVIAFLLLVVVGLLFEWLLEGDLPPEQLPPPGESAQPNDPRAGLAAPSSRRDPSIA
jgi:hypothetical protein